MSQGRSTSERVSEHAYATDPRHYLIYCMHVATYQFVIPHVADRTVLDFGCGTGYGARLLAPHAAQVDGIDISSEAVRQATVESLAENTTFRQIAPVEKAPLPYADDSFDVVLSFQVIEHVADVDAYLRETRRVLRPGGTFICATPNRDVRLRPRQRPWNVFHLDEFSPSQLVELMRARYDTVDLHGMTSDPPDILASELDRYARMRRLTLPFTFPGAPESWRRTGLQTLKRVKDLTGQSPPAGFTPDYGPGDIAIRPESTDGPVILTVAS